MTGRRSFIAGGACAAVCAAVRPFAARAADALPALPEYYAGYLPQVAARINALKQRTDDGFFFLTDLHIPAHRTRSGQLIADLIGRTRLRNVYCGGDFPQAYGADPQANVDAPLTGGNVALADGVTAVIANAVSGFWYSWEAADEPTGPFTPVGDPVRASLDGELEMSLAEPIRSRRFYRLRVSGKAH